MASPTLPHSINHMLPINSNSIILSTSSISSSIRHISSTHSMLLFIILLTRNMTQPQQHTPVQAPMTIPQATGAPPQQQPTPTPAPAQAPPRSRKRTHQQSQQGHAQAQQQHQQVSQQHQPASHQPHQQPTPQQHHQHLHQQQQAHPVQVQQPHQQSTPQQPHTHVPAPAPAVQAQQAPVPAAAPAAAAPVATTPVPPPAPAAAPAAQQASAVPAAPTPTQETNATPAPPAKKSRTNTPWTPAEELRLKQMRDAGNSWAEIAKTFPSRTEGSVKKHWYKDMHYAEFAEDESAALLTAIKEYENNKWKTIGQKVGKPAKACEQYAKEHFPDLFANAKGR
ncbi:O-glycoside alpha-1,2-mannosyltransferase 4 [Pestalotiopsis sp. IQ-011]